MFPKLRDYQEDLIQRAREAMGRHRRVLVVSCTGSGKTVIFAFITMSASSRGKTVYITAHRAEIVDQIGKALASFGVRHGRIQPGHTMTRDPVQIGMVQTMARRVDRLPEPDLLIVDEAHHATAGTWRTLSDAWQRCRILGVTATPERLDGRGLGEVFEHMEIGPDSAELISRGFLAGYDLYVPPSDLDLSSVHTRMGEFAADELQAAIRRSSITGSAVAEYRRYLDGRPSVAFCVSLSHAEETAEAFRVAGYRAASVDGSMSRDQRTRLLDGLASGGLNVLTSCELISEGVDVPMVAGAILLRPTKSLGMYLQQVGRALRLKPDNSRAVILDHAGNVMRHGAPDRKREWSLDAKKRRVTTGASVCGVCYRAFDPETKAEQSCYLDQPPDCALRAVERNAGSDRGLEEIDGDLVTFREVEEVNPPWTRGLSLRRAPLKDILRVAREDWQVQEIASARGYKAGWAHQVIKLRRSRSMAEPKFEV